MSIGSTKDSLRAELKALASSIPELVKSGGAIQARGWREATEAGMKVLNNSRATESSLSIAVSRIRAFW
jgi:ElaB/YqjD/DUF883 family membrane-anchored ribosome-binding protein